MSRGQCPQGATDIVRRYRHGMHIRKLCDALHHRQAANLLQIGTHHADSVLRDDFLKSFEQVLARGNRNANLRVVAPMALSRSWANITATWLKRSAFVDVTLRNAAMGLRGSSRNLCHFSALAPSSRVRIDATEHDAEAGVC